MNSISSFEIVALDSRVSRKINFYSKLIKKIKKVTYRCLQVMCITNSTNRNTKAIYLVYNGKTPDNYKCRIGIQDEILTKFHIILKYHLMHLFTSKFTLVNLSFIVVLTTSSILTLVLSIPNMM